MEGKRNVESHTKASLCMLSPVLYPYLSLSSLCQPLSERDKHILSIYGTVPSGGILGQHAKVCPSCVLWLTLVQGIPPVIHS
jgi:hypothetical protein